MFNKILVPLDGSELATEVLLFVQALALKSQAKVVLFRAYHEPDDGAHPDLASRLKAYATMTGESPAEQAFAAAWAAGRAMTMKQAIDYALSDA